MSPASPLPRRGFLARMIAAWTGGAGLGSWGPPSPAEAVEDDPPYLGEIRMFAGNVPPNGWVFCEGQLLDPNTYNALFNLIGTTYGGDGQTTFGLPDLRSRVPIHSGGGSYVLGQAAGAETIVLNGNQIPVHTHAAGASSANGTSDSPAGCVPARNAAGVPSYGPTQNTTLAATGLLSTGGSAPHNNMQPYLGIHFMIALDGIFPSQT